MEGYDKEVDAVTVDELKAVFGRRNGKWELFKRGPNYEAFIGRRKASFVF
jgi:hypothetical protein